MSGIITGEAVIEFEAPLRPPVAEPLLTSYEELGNRELQIYRHKAEIIEALQNNPITGITAETGTGKSTQVPQYAIEAGVQTVFHTQPRRRAASNVAERIALELGSVLGDGQ